MEEYFPPKHRAEIFCLKGDFLLKMNDSDAANVSYSNAISIYKHLAKGWISWGNYCDMVNINIQNASYNEQRKEESYTFLCLVPILSVLELASLYKHRLFYLESFE